MRKRGRKRARFIKAVKRVVRSMKRKAAKRRMVAVVRGGSMMS